MVTLFAIAAVTAGLPLLALAAQRRQRRPAAVSSFFGNWHGLRLRYASTDKTALALFFFIAGVTTVGLMFLLCWLGGCYQASLPAGVYDRMPKLTPLSFLLPAMVLGILIGALATDLVLRRAMGDRFGEYEFAFGGGAPGRPGDRGMPLLTLVVAGLATGLVTMSVDHYSRFEEERVVVNPFWGYGEVSYPYSAVEAVVRTSHVYNKGREYPHTRYFILFADGRRWCNEDYGGPASGVLREDAELADFVCRQSGKPLTCVKHIEDFPGQ